MHIRTSGVLSADSLSGLRHEIRPLPKDEWTSFTSLTTSYVSDTWVPLAAARQHFDEALGGTAAFDKWIIGAITISPSEAYKTHNTTDKVRGDTRSLTYPVAGRRFCVDLEEIPGYIRGCACES